MNGNKASSNARTTKAVGAEARAARVVDCDQIFMGAREVRLLHGSEEYRLRITRNQKLILTK